MKPITIPKDPKLVVFTSFVHLGRLHALGKVSHEQLRDRRAHFLLGGKTIVFEAPGVVRSPGVFEAGGPFPHVLADFDDRTRYQVQAEIIKAIEEAERREASEWFDSADTITVGVLRRFLAERGVDVELPFNDSDRLYPHVPELREFLGTHNVRLVFNVF